MWQVDNQKYNKLSWICESEGTVKDTLLNKMGMSVRLMVSLKSGDGIRKNNKKASVKETVEKGDLIEACFPEEKNDYMPQKIDLTIHYEDDDLLVVEKPYDMVVHPTKTHYNDTMLNGILYYFKENNIHSKVRFVNRLDRYTSGVLLVAKNKFAHSFMSKNNGLWEMDKEYIAVVQGQMSGEGTIKGKIALAEDGIKREVRSDGQEAITHYRVIASSEKASLLSIQLETGRTHQIRVHMSHLGHPLLGDELYGGDTSAIARQALHATKLGFFSPRKEKKQEIKIMLPDDIRELIDRLFGLSFDKID